jgi:hypothetical protein
MSFMGWTDHLLTVFIMVTNFVLSVSDSTLSGTGCDIYSCQFGGPLASSVFLIVLSIAGEDHLHTVWRVCFGVGIVLPLTVLIFRLRMLSSKLYRKGAIKSKCDQPLCRTSSREYNDCLERVPYYLVVKRYWRSLIGTCGAW